VLRGQTLDKSYVIPSIFQPNGPVDVFVDELFRLAASGDQASVKKVFFLYGCSDGGYAETFDDGICKLLASHPEAVLKNWNVLEEAGLVSKGFGGTCGNELAEGIKQVESLSDKYPAASRQVLAILREK